MADDREHVTYREADTDYFDRRGLNRYAGVFSLWALGVGAVISGDFSGWNLGVGIAGFGGFLLAVAVITVMYIGLCFSIAEMSPALPHTGGAYSFARTALGPWGGYVTGLAENMEYVITTAVVCYFAAAYLQNIFSTPDAVQPLWWLGLYVVFVGMNVLGVEASFRFVVVITLIALAILALFFVSAIPYFEWENLWNIEPDPGQTRFLPKGVGAVGAALPFAIWLYLAIEQLPLASEESVNVSRDMPRGMLWGLSTLVVTGVLVTFLNMGIGGGAAYFGSETEEPLLDGLKITLGVTSAKLLGVVAVAGLIASFHAIIYAYGRNIYSLSRAGYFPTWLSVTHRERKTPYVALISGAVVGYAVLIVLFVAGDSGAFGGVILNMAVFGAVIAYAMQMAAYLVLKTRYPDIRRPYVSPVGAPGAWVALIIALTTLVLLFLNPAFHPGVLGVAIWFIAGLAYFAFYARHRMIASPEEAFARAHSARALSAAQRPEETSHEQ
ncbi:MAG: amino acid permease [Pseudomonadales bacterium]|jgi:ethanolamine permease|nr:amino acid permease [Pseudomonadales bacterium]MDP6470839.1 amino acid permease [Pseudomonadales bacterium]MDP6825976.1 amino acid permease [Pseudomonadales bacterium]MDP6972288.1 amino acid permease [Pseudomonadales bacterium]|tara:strand:- start:5386 stop:6876 length:1491 start_codon:yes stop_codon:yes gene_type:complete